MQGIDENRTDRIVGFSEQQLSTFAFEVWMKSADKSGQIRFNENLAENLFKLRAENLRNSPSGEDAILLLAVPVLPAQKEGHQSPC